MTTTATPNPGAITLPPRPRDIPIDDVEPCSLFTEQQRAELSLEGRPRSSTGVTQIFGAARSCDITVFEPRAVAVGSTLVTTTGIERFTDGGLAAKLTPISIGGFPAVIAIPSRSDDYCSVEIDVAAGQLIDVQFALIRLEPTVPVDQLCRRAQDVAGEVMATLIAR